MIPMPVMWDKMINGNGIDTSDATATAEDIAVGKTAYVGGEKVTGNKEDNMIFVDEPVTNGIFVYVGDNVKKLVVPPGVAKVYFGAKTTSSTSYQIPSGLESLELPATVTSVDTYFERLYQSNEIGSLKNIKLPNNISCTASYSSSYHGTLETAEIILSSNSSTSSRKILMNMFFGHILLKKVTLPIGIKSIENFAFYGCTSLTSINIPDSVTSIGDGVFQNCINLTSINIPSSVTSMGMNAFYGCSNLAHIYYNGTESQWNAITKGTNWNSSMGSNVTGGTQIHFNYTG